METISGDSGSHTVQHKLPDPKISTPPISNPIKQIPNSKSSELKLNALSNLTERAVNSGSDIREDVIAKARDLISDPDWLSDDRLLQLSQRLLNSGDF